MILEWRLNQPNLVLEWLGPNKISTTAIRSMADVESKIAVISGPKGAKGDQGNPGLPGDGSATYVWVSPGALIQWVIAHNQQKYPAVTVVDSTGRILLGDVTYLNNNLVEIAFAFPVSGTAYLN